MVRVRCIAGLLALIPCVQSQMPTLQIPEDLACSKGPHAKAWAAAKDRFRLLMEEPKNMFELIPPTTIKTALDAAIADVKSGGGFDKSAGNECGYGRLAIQLLSVALMDDPVMLAQPLQEMQVMANPVMTLLLDIPWVATALSGWPFFGILAQVGLHKVARLNGLLDYDAVDGLADAASADYFTKVSAAADNSDLLAMADISYAYLQAPSEKIGVLGSLTALASQAALQSDVEKRMSACNALQEAMRTAIGDASELDIALTTRWPLWSLLHISVDAFSANPIAPAARA
mmetsp:Transcript_89236/g.158219  ORF Transcript_89236/g.158219 Transcript_89236/m.158219 type:complete len:288 (-) Transcript_89236:55-918(-)|eukprot:CAMPEP_0197650140 /NCGR_PEP_ID=MMETSP1338-20131121/30765_1 /TAXON_ID=43686 ORGANISM="Pelagodinium beii, Strain RCC1491" /NCGR_SAMPLE_ID=MMETSP1338 /ASSEMBLY_ACC=CAM_ASM_000754 /LENGTH=287 /DNA_ID=CAMNT_0043224491 /DNA_START=63 /DNA_END=926 /DNA_ORIENTATION=-